MMDRLAIGLAQRPSTRLSRPVGSMILQYVNDIVAPYGMSFKNGWKWSAPSGNEPDLAYSGAIPMVPAGTLTQAQATGLPGEDRGFFVADNSTGRFAPSSTASLDVASTDLVILHGAQHTAAPTAGGRTMIIKGSTTLYQLWFSTTNGQPQARVISGATVAATVAVDHTADTKMNIYLMILKRDALGAGAHRLSLTTQRGDSGLVDASGVGSLTNAVAAQIGRSSASANQRGSFTFWSNAAGSIQPNRVQLVKAIQAGLGVNI